MVTVEAFSQVVSEIYASAIEPDNWTRTMSEISRLAHATGSGLIVGADSHHQVLLGSHMPEEAVRSYEEYYHRLDHVRTECARSPVGLIRGGQEVNAGKTHTEFHADWQRRFDLTDGLFVRLSAGPSPTSFAISGPKRGERFDNAERVTFVNALIRHLQQALGTQRRLAGAGRSLTALSEIIDMLPHGVVIIGCTRQVLHINSAAMDILASADGIRRRENNIEAAHSPTNSLLQMAISEALFGRHGGGIRGGNSIPVSRPSERRQYVLHVIPMEAPFTDVSGGQALIVIVDPDSQPELPKSLLKRIFGLTNAEAEVALRATTGHGLGRIADDLALSTATVKTHLQRVFEKTNTHRQAELARLLLTVDPLTHRHVSETA